MNRRMVILWVAVASATGCGLDPRRSGETGKLLMEIHGEDYKQIPIAPIAVGSSTWLLVEFFGEWADRTIDVQSTDTTLVPNQTVTFKSYRCEFLHPGCENHNTSHGFELKPQRSGKVRLMFYEKGEIVDAVTLEVREPKTLVVHFSDHDGNPLPQNPTVPVGSRVKLKATALDETGQPLVVSEGFKFENYENLKFEYPQTIYTDGWSRAETFDYTVTLGEVVKPFQVTFK